jgi:hypothetical protein
MRDLTKSILSYTWALSVFGIQQAANIFRRGKRQDSRGMEGFDGVTAAIRDELDDTLKAAYRAGDNLQRGMVDLMFGGLTALNMEQWTRCAERMAGTARDATQRTADAARTGGRGCTDDQMPPGASFGRPPSAGAGGCWSETHETNAPRANTSD